MELSRFSFFAARCLAAVITATALLAAAPARAQTAASAPEAPIAAPAEEPTGPQPIPAAEVAGKAQQAQAQLLEFRALAERTPAMEKVSERLPQIRVEIDRLQPDAEIELSNLATQALVQGQRAQWSRLANELKADRKAAGDRAVDLRKAIEELSELRVVWERTSEAAVVEGLPPVVISRIGDTLASILDVERLIKNRRAEVLTLQNQIAESEEVAVLVIARLVDSEKRFQEELFKSKHAPLWKLVSAEQRQEERQSERRSVWGEDPKVSASYIAQHERGLVLFGVMMVALFIGLIVLRPRAGLLAEENADFEPTARLMQRPFSATLMVSMLVFPVTFVMLPRVIAGSFWALLPIPFLRLLPVLIGKDVNPAIYGLTAWYAVAWSRIFLVASPSAVRWVMFAESIGVLAFMAFLLHPSRLAKLEQPRLSMIAIRILLLASIGLLIAAAVSNAIGNITLAQLLDEGALVAHCVAVMAYGSFKILSGMLALLMRTRVARQLRMIRHHESNVRRRCIRLLWWVHVGFWTYLTLDAFRIRETVFGAVVGTFEARVTMGDLDLSLSDVTAFALMVWASFLISRFVRFVLDEDILPRTSLPRGVPFAVSVLVRYTILLTGFMMAVAAAGIDMSRFALMVGALGVGIGIGLQDVVNNFVSGLILLFERPIQRGDTVEVGEMRGEIATIGLRASTLRTFDGAEMVIPNSQFVSHSFVNWTLSDRQRRIIVTVGVEYGTEPDRVLQILLDVARGEPKILNQPEPRALMIGFGESSLNFELRAWTAEVEAWMSIRSELTVEINRALAEAGITIPFPQRDLHLRSVVDP